MVSLTTHKDGGIRGWSAGFTVDLWSRLPLEMLVGFLAGPGPGPRPALASVADIELKCQPVSRQEEHIAALSPRQNTSHFFF